MSFFTIQNHDVPLKAAVSPTRTPQLIGDRGISFGGKPLLTIQSIKGLWKGTTIVLGELDGRFLSALLEGRGHTWDFEDVTTFAYSSKGLGPTSGSAGNGAQYTTTSKFGSAGLQVTASSQIQFNVGYSFEWTAMVWKGSNLSTANHYIVNSAGHKWVDGVSNDAASTPFISMSGGNFLLGDPSGSTANQRFDDLVLIDAVIPSNWAVDFGVMTAAFSPLPKLRCKGDLLWNNVYYALGSDVVQTYAQGVVDGVFYDDLSEIEFTLTEHTRVS